MKIFIAGKYNLYGIFLIISLFTSCISVITFHNTPGKPETSEPEIKRLIFINANSANVTVLDMRG